MDRREIAKLATAINGLAESLDLHWKTVLDSILSEYISEEDASLVTEYMCNYH